MSDLDSFLSASSCHAVTQIIIGVTGESVASICSGKPFCHSKQVILTLEWIDLIVHDAVCFIVDAYFFSYKATEPVRKPELRLIGLFNPLGGRLVSELKLLPEQLH